MIGDRILAAKLVFNGRERVRDVFNLEGKEGTAAGGIGQLLENAVAPEDQPAVVG